MQLSLVMHTAEGERRDFKVEGTKATIGRNTESTIQIPLSVISRRHCELSVKGKTILVRDLGSSNGTYVNNKRVQESPLNAGDTLTVGPVVFTVVVDGKPNDVKPIRTVLDKPKAKASVPAPSKPQPAAKKPSPADTGSIDLDDSQASVDMDAIELEDENNPLSELEELSKQKKL